jgi:dATP pyrophosphohydrolase
VADSGQPDAVSIVVLEGRGDATQLLVIRRAGGAFAGAWTYVMGGVEPGERAPQTALRELAEETGLHADALYLAGAFDVFYDPRRDRIRNVAVFVARVATRNVTVDDAHDAYRWVSFAEAAELLEFPSQRRLLDDVRRDFVERDPSSWRNIAVT